MSTRYYIYTFTYIYKYVPVSTSYCLCILVYFTHSMYVRTVLLLAKADLLSRATKVVLGNGHQIASAGDLSPAEDWN